LGVDEVAHALRENRAKNTGAVGKGFKVSPFKLLTIQNYGMSELESGVIRLSTAPIGCKLTISGGITKRVRGARSRYKAMIATTYRCRHVGAYSVRRDLDEG